MSEPSQATPPHLPTYNVRLSSNQIGLIVQLALPGYEMTSSTQLQSSKSYNNRIYFVETQADLSTTALNIDQDHEHLVLKVSGHYFSARKVQNEIGALRLLQMHCPTLPVPQIVAWSEEGRVIQTIDGRVIDTSHSTQEESDTSNLNQATCEQGWILMTRLRGRSLTDADLEHQNGQLLLKQLASYVQAWRTCMPATTCIGNLRVDDATVPRDEQLLVFKLPVNALTTLLSTPSLPQNSDFTIGGLILCYNYNPSALSSPLAYYKYFASDQLAFLRQVPWLSPLRAQIEDTVQSFIDNTIPHLSFLRHASATTTDPSSVHKINTPSYFTHLDLSPRNILVSPVSSHIPASHGFDSTKASATSTDVPDTLEITGLLDFEFAAFLPPEEEFINMGVRQTSDWPSPHYDTLLRELRDCGVEVPHSPHRPGSKALCEKATTGKCSCDDGAFEGLCVLAEVIDGIKPWHLQEGSHVGEELQREIEKAVREVKSGIAKLEEYVVRE